MLLFQVGLLSCGSSTTEIAIVSNDEEKENPDIEPIAEIFSGTIRDISSSELVAEMGIGWNLGNSFDVISKDKTDWGNPLPNGNIIKTVHEIGFKTLRVPITWRFNQEDVAPYTIEEAYLNRVQQVVNYGLKNKMHVIINVHHDEEWAKPTFDNEEMAKERLRSLWTQVAEKFKSYGDSLVFEILNEPRLIGSDNEWSGGTQEGRQVLNALNKTGVDAIRSTGGNNEKRHLMIPTYAASTLPIAMDDLVIPNDDANIIISLHSYFPWSFAGLAQDRWGSDSDKTQLRQEFDRIRDKWMVQEQRAVILGEWGSIVDNAMDDRLDYAGFYVKEATSRGLLTIVWDDGGNFQLLDRNSLTWVHGEIAEMIIQSAK